MSPLELGFVLAAFVGAIVATWLHHLSRRNRR